MDDGYMKVWSDLVAAYCNNETVCTEIYAYHLQPFLPSLLLQARSKQAQKEMADIAFRRLVELSRQFERVMDCKLYFEIGPTRDKGVSLSDFEKSGFVFDHRIIINIL